MSNTETYSFANPELSHARVNDVIAKIAKVTLKDTTRVLKALNLVCVFTGDDADYIVSSTLSPEKPTQQQSVACVAAYDLVEVVMGPESIADIRKMD